MQTIFRKHGSISECIHESFVLELRDKADIHVLLPYTINLSGWKDFLPNATIDQSPLPDTKYELIIGKLTHMIHLNAGGLLIIHEHLPSQALPSGLEKVIWTRQYTYLYKERKR